jgi:hypothetical protein
MIGPLGKQNCFESTADFFVRISSISSANGPILSITYWYAKVLHELYLKKAPKIYISLSLGLLSVKSGLMAQKLRLSRIQKILYLPPEQKPFEVERGKRFVCWCTSCGQFYQHERIYTNILA